MINVGLKTEVNICIYVYIYAYMLNILYTYNVDGDFFTYCLKLNLLLPCDFETNQYTIKYPLWLFSLHLCLNNDRHSFVMKPFYSHTAILCLF